MGLFFPRRNGNGQAGHEGPGERHVLGPCALVRFIYIEIACVGGEACRLHGASDRSWTVGWTVKLPVLAEACHRGRWGCSLQK